jgi:endonuclease/exonuclease/phosphatase (EEP) superfamily protein YafD
LSPPCIGQFGAVLQPFILGSAATEYREVWHGDKLRGRILPAMSLRILTQNLYNGRAEPASLALALRDHSPDVVAVQELSSNCVDVLADWGTSSLLAPRDDLTGMGIAVRGNAEFSRLSFPHRDPVRAILAGEQWGFDAAIEIVNAHLVNPIGRPLRTSLRLRKAEVAALEDILRRDSGAQTRVLVGDLNSSPAWPVYRRLATVATDAARATGTARRTWGPKPASPRLLRIDHAFVQRAQAIRTQLVCVTGADHRGLLVDLDPVR